MGYIQNKALSTLFQASCGLHDDSEYLLDTDPQGIFLYIDVIFCDAANMFISCKYKSNSPILTITENSLSFP